MRLLAAVSLVALILAGLFTGGTSGGEVKQQPVAATKEGIEFFEKKIRPVLVEQCYKCHSAEARKADKLRGQLLLDTEAGLLKGGETGIILVPGKPKDSRLLKLLRHEEEPKMPPKGRLRDAVIANFEKWIEMGVPYPRGVVASESLKKPTTPNIDAGRAWWAFRPVSETATPIVKQKPWARKKVDFFVLQELEAGQLAPSPRADPRTLIQRVYLDLIGLRPSFEQTEAFANDPSDQAYEQIIEQLLASPQYGERWGRYWLDVARYGEDNPTSEATNRPYPYAWRYRDWVIEAFNRDVPYNTFVSLQLAGDLIPKTPRGDLAATGFLGAGPIYHKDSRLSKDVIENLYMDDWDERVDVVSRGVLGLTVACARCHDHIFDPITTRDYYALAGVFASTVATVRSTADVPLEIEKRFMVATQRLFYLSYVANLMRSEPGTDPKAARKKVEQFTKDLDKIEAEIADLRDKYPVLHSYLAKLDKRPAPYENTKPAAPADKQQRPRGGNPATEPFYQSVFDAGLWVDGSDSELTLLDIEPGKPRDLHVLPGGNVAKPGELAPRGFLSVLAKGDPAFHNGSGRRELADKIFTDAAPLAARVLVNRVWGWHFGKPLVGTPSDFGAQGEKPSHPQLLDDLAARFIANGWSLKWLHREIMLSAAYQQASRPRPDAAKLDPANRLLWRMNPRRLDIEAYRDCILQAGSGLDTKRGGPSTGLEQTDNKRRTVYGRVSRGRVNGLLLLYDFPEPTMHSPGREYTTTPLQQLFVLNSPFVRDQAVALAASVAKEPDVSAKVRALYHKVLSRDPSKHELALAGEYLATGTMTDYAHALLCTNEVIFWP
jgi:Protein of unknown function (DUF1553)/Protein of unknown function (DUF1549)/Planctomycete cytochrome C